MNFVLLDTNIVSFIFKGDNRLQPYEPYLKENILSISFASGGQNPFYKKGSGLPKIFYWEGLDTLFFFVPLCVSLWLKIGGGFWPFSLIDIFTLM